MSDNDQNINININAPGKPKQPFVPRWLVWFFIWLTVLGFLATVRQCF